MREEKNILAQAFNKTLPGIYAQQQMSPSVRSTNSIKYDPSNARSSSVLILLFKKDDQWLVPLIKRPKYNGAHSGQISFPGGKYEKSDGNYVETALREANEEIGINRDDIEFVASLSSLYIPNSNFIVYPQVFITEVEPFFVPDQREVETVIEAPVKHLLAPETIQSFRRKINGIEVDAPFYNVDDHVIWGATAMIMSEFLTLLKDVSFLTNPLSHSCSACNAPECR